MSPDELSATASTRPADPVQQPARLRIYRTSPEDEGSRQILCSLDGDYIGQLLFGETLTRDIPPGPHRLSINNTLFWKTLSFTADPGATVEYTVRNLTWGGTLMKMLFVFFGAGPLKLAVEAGPPHRR